MPTASTDARADLAALCERGIDWRLGPQRVLRNDAPARDAAVLVLFGILDSDSCGRLERGRPATSTCCCNAGPRRSRATPDRSRFRVAASNPPIRMPQPQPSREAVEETGLDPAGVDVLGTLTPFPVPVSNHLVTPVPAWWRRPSEVAAVDHAETVETFRVPVADLVDPANRAMTEHQFDGQRLPLAGLRRRWTGRVGIHGDGPHAHVRGPRVGGRLGRPQGRRTLIPRRRERVPNIR